ncbi:MAG: alpha/beta fold hydrolase [Arenimonas sp.]
MKQTGFVGLPAKTYIDGFDWVSPNRLLFSIAEKEDGPLVEPFGTGELYGVNADGSGQSHALVGYRAEVYSPGGTHINKKSNEVNGYLINTLKDDDDSVMLEVFEYGKAFTEMHKMNVNSGSRVTVAKAPVRRANITTDVAGNARFAMGADIENNTKTYYKDGPKAEWVLINDQAQSGLNVAPVGMNADNTIGYLIVEEEKGPDALYAMDTKTLKRTLIVKDETANPSYFFKSPLDDSLFGIGYANGYPHIMYLDKENPYAKITKSVQATLKEKFVVPISYTKDGNLIMFAAEADNASTAYYLFDRTKDQLSYVAENSSWLKPEQMALTDVYQITSRDGLKMEAFLTLPKGSDGKNLPLIVNPHGGPFNAADGWGFNPEVQLLANRGYAVLQVNFRGSEGYGRDFETKGYKQWGGTMQDDLTDATRWAIKSGIADPKRICIYGASYGGYAALMGAAKEPDLYACAVGNVGVYDMNMMYGRGDVLDGTDDYSIKFLEKTLGKEKLKEISPTQLASRIKAPVLMFAGRQDRRAPPIHTETMQKALLANGKSVEVKIYENESHGNFLIENDIDLANRLLAFLDKYIGPSSQAAKKN